MEENKKYIMGIDPINSKESNSSSLLITSSIKSYETHLKENNISYTKYLDTYIIDTAQLSKEQLNKLYKI